MLASSEIADDTLNQLLEVIYRNYHYDFRFYARASLRRSVALAQASLGIGSATDLVEHVAARPSLFAELLRHLTVQVSDLFRDPGYFRLLREEVVPHLATYPSPKVWVAGCCTGEEAYSIAIILHEEGLLARSRIYATDIDHPSLAKAQAGVYDAARLEQFASNYLEAGGQGAFSDYYERTASRISLAPHLARHIVFTDHSLATDAVFAEVQLISCRNVLIYFDRTLQDRAIQLFRDSLCPRGLLGLGSKETLAFSSHATAFEPFHGSSHFYRLKRPPETPREK